MCLSCGCGKPNDDHGDSRNITLDDLNRAAQAAGTTRDKVLQNIMGGASAGQSSGQTSARPAQPSVNGQESNSFLPADQPRPQPGKPYDNQGQESGTDWQESQQMGRTGRGGVQKPQEE